MMKSTRVWTILVFLLLLGDLSVRGLPLSNPSGEISGQSDDQWEKPEDDAEVQEPSWEAEYSVNDQSHLRDNDDDSYLVESTTQKTTRPPFNKSIFMEAQRDKLPAITQCHDAFMTVDVPRSAFGARGALDKSVLVVQSACRLDIRINETHVAFNISYDSFSDRCEKATSGSCCRNLRAIRYEVGLVYLLEVPIEIFIPGAEPKLEDAMAYCYFETAKHNEDLVSHTWINLYSKMYDPNGFSGAWLPLTSSEVAFLEIITEEGPSEMENLPINCWLSAHATKEESSRDMPDALFLKDGCPAHGDASISSFARGYRVGFTPAAYKKQDKKFLYVHCQYLKCSIGSGEDVVGKLPPCPSGNHCLSGTPPEYRKRQLSTATSDVILQLVKKSPQPIDTPTAPKSAADRPCNPSECKNLDGVVDVANEQSLSHFQWILIGLAFIFGGILTLGFVCLYHRCKRQPTAIPMMSVKETSIGGLQQALIDKELSARGLPGPPDVLAQTPESKRVHLCRPDPPVGRQRHMAGRDGFQPPKPADSIHDYSRAGESIIALKDASWNRKIELHDEKD